MLRSILEVMQVRRSEITINWYKPPTFSSRSIQASLFPTLYSCPLFDECCIPPFLPTLGIKNQYQKSNIKISHTGISI